MSHTRPVVTAIIEREGKVYMHKRNKPVASPNFVGLWELPAGGIEEFESVIDALRREVFEETGLIVTSLTDVGGSLKIENIPGNSTQIFQPYTCQQVLTTNGGLHWIGYVFRVKASGVVSVNEQEATEPQWFSKNELRDLVINHPELIFPLQYPVLMKYVKDSGTDLL